MAATRKEVKYAGIVAMDALFTEDCRKGARRNKTETVGKRAVLSKLGSSKKVCTRCLIKATAKSGRS